MVYSTADNAPITLNYSEEWTLNGLNGVRHSVCLRDSLSMHLSSRVTEESRNFTAVCSTWFWLLFHIAAS